MASSDARRTVAILGSTGSVGTQALDLIRANRDMFQVVGLAAGSNSAAVLSQQAHEFGVPAFAVGMGAQAATEIAGSGADVVLNAITGSVGLRPTLAALHGGSSLALANKESLVAGGELVRAALQRPDQIVPVDSEHSAIAQCLRSGTAGEVRRLILTASGGPFRGRSRADLLGVTAAQALAHPTWQMGPVVTVNSASMMNKALELIEAYWLFGVAPNDICVVVHPQSVVHSMVEFVDGATIAQASPPDMHLPIALGLSWPARLPGATKPCDWSAATSWDFEPLD
ncbi:MAG: 1-deoxy-D-xylulose-5-phosphate reductoisomerase, partial [Cellulomonadaceae bacterium]|nr:1-deoxy-D-xylulose-5-phosphate reductoisomerase [Cellulomonadaceae bacterium]